MRSKADVLEEPELRLEAGSTFLVPQYRTVDSSIPLFFDDVSRPSCVTPDVMLKVPSGSQLGTGNSDLRNLWFCVLCFSKIAFQKGLCRYAFHVSFAGLEKTVFCSCFDVSKGAD